MNKLLLTIEALLQAGRPREVVLEEILREVLKDFSSESGTIHRLEPQTQTLQLATQVGLPPQLLEIIKTIPVGKGIAGQVVAQNRPVTICNLQTDTDGVAQPGAKQTGVGGALCVPVRVGDNMVGTLGIGTLRAYAYTPEETRRLEDVGQHIGLCLQG